MKKLLFVVCILLVIGVSSSSAQSYDLPTVDVIDLMFADLSHYVMVKIGDYCEMMTGGMGWLLYQPFTQPYTITIYAEKSAYDCTGPVLQSWSITDLSQSSTLFIYPNVSGDMAWSLHVNDNSPIPNGHARFHVRNGYGGMSSADFVIRRNGNSPPITFTLAQGGYTSIDIRPGARDISLENADRPYEAFRWDIPYRPGEHWLLEIGGPVNEDNVIGIWDYPYQSDTKWQPHYH